MWEEEYRTANQNSIPGLPPGPCVPVCHIFALGLSFSINNLSIRTSLRPALRFSDISILLSLASWCSTLPAVGTLCLPWGRPACRGDALPAVGTLCLPWGHPACLGDALPAVGTPCLCGLCCHVLRRASALSPGTHDPGVLKL